MTAWSKHTCNLTHTKPYSENTHKKYFQCITIIHRPTTLYMASLSSDGPWVVAWIHFSTDQRDSTSASFRSIRCGFLESREKGQASYIHSFVVESSCAFDYIRARAVQGSKGLSTNNFVIGNSIWIEIEQLWSRGVYLERIGRREKSGICGKRFSLVRICVHPAQRHNGRNFRMKRNTEL